MNVFKWELIKKKAAVAITSRTNNFAPGSAIYYALIAGIEQQITGEKIKSWRKNTKDLTDKAIDIIRHWDIRKAQKLVELFPEVVPQKCQHKTPFIDMDEEGNWCLIYN